MFKRKKELIVNGFKLDKEQIKAVTTKRKNVLVLAGAGSGKSLTIIGRVKYLVHELNVNPKDILCISFTNDAVNNLKQDLNEKKVDVMTFHKLALKILGKQKEVLTENMLKDIVMDAFSNYSLLALYNMTKREMINLIETFINLFKSNNYKVDMFYKFINKK